MEIRKLEVSDITMVQELLSKFKPYVLPYSNYVYWILNNYFSSTCFVAEEENKIIGFISALPSVDKEYLFIWQVAVDTDYHHLGIGSKLLDAVIAEAKNKSYKSIEFSIDSKNIASQNMFSSKAEKLDSHMDIISTYTTKEYNEIVYSININPDL
jgi:L-2,4-diaminobutyric acid acetyltransferase